METKHVDYICKFCKHEWNKEYQLQAMPPVDVRCPICNKVGNFEKVLNFFEKQAKLCNK